MVKNGTLASPAMARASSVLPVPGGPTSKQPLGILPPSRWNFWGSFRKSTISSSSALASSMPATSSKVTRPCFSVSRRARDCRSPWRGRCRSASGAEEDVDTDQNQHGQPAHKDRAEIDALFRWPGVDAIDVLDQHRHQLLVDRRARHVGRELLHAVARFAEGAGDGVALDTDVLDLALLDGAHEVGIGNSVARRPGRSTLEDAVEQRQQQHDDNPQGSVTVERVHGCFPMGCENILDGEQATRRKQKKQPESGAAPRFCHLSCHARANNPLQATTLGHLSQ